MNRVLLVLSLAFLVTCSPALPATQENQTFQVGAIYYFGYAGLDLPKLQQSLPIRIGESVHLADQDPVWVATRKAVQRVTGKPATDIARICCDESHRLLIYIGLSGTSSRPLTTSDAPRGTAHLEEPAPKLYDQAMAAMADAVRHGVAGEDDSRGYAVPEDPAFRRVILAVRSYAVQRGPEFERVLEHSADPQQRRVSAWLLGYAERSPAQIQSLAAAANDADAETRNNAVRALGVLASQKDALPLKIDPSPFIALLFSGTWTDRNKGSWILEKLTQSRDPGLLNELRNKALQPLIEGAKWDSGHAGFFLVILSRLTNLPFEQIQKLVQGSEEDQVIQAAEHAVRHNKL